IHQGGFSTKKANLLGMSKGAPPFQGTYRHEKVGPLRFALSFNNEGARLEFSILSPDGKSFSCERDSTVMLEVPEAKAGDWRYTVKQVRLPYENFPYKVSVVTDK